ncbi:hypothetical protein [Halobellus salinisoli]|uniref:hypothetical protein n=1 Tax=Halobellus salinisoli TaxID=3108500 RepID=UPI00300925B4
MTGEEICTIKNIHVEECGEPPEIDYGKYSYVSYFEGIHGDQSFFLYDSRNEEVIVYLADAGWDNPQKISAQRVLNNETVPKGDDIGILPEKSEKAWLKACKMAVKAQIAQDLR